ncbi:hypothetical protein DMUE_2562, partial [Dictyocoela muelleri]
EHDDHNRHGTFRTDTASHRFKGDLDRNKLTGGVETINIFTHYFINGYPLRVDHVNLNSRTNSLNILQYIEQLSNNITKKFKTTQFDHEVPNTGLKIKRELPLFDSFSVDLFSEIELFKTSISLTNWDKELFYMF